MDAEVRRGCGMMKRNIGKHTRSAEAKLRILRHIAHHGPITFKSAMGYVAYPDYSFKTPQGAAFAVSRIAREMFDDGLITEWLCRAPYGIQITQVGRFVLAKANGGKA